MSPVLVAPGETTLTQWLASNSRSAIRQIDVMRDEFSKLGKLIKQMGKLLRYRRR